MKIFLLNFDGEQLFHNERGMTIIKVFEFPDKEKDPYHKLFLDLFVLKIYDVRELLSHLFEEDGDCLPERFLLKIEGVKRKRWSSKFISYYKRREEEFFKDMDGTWLNHDITSYAFVSDAQKLLSVMYNCSNHVENNDKQFDFALCD